MTTLPDWANWLARDENGKIFAYEKPPYKEDVAWEIKDDYNDYRLIMETDDAFSHIKWTDEEPTKVKRVTGLGLATSDKYNRITIAKVHWYDEVPEVADIINEPNHYKGKHGIETIDVIRNFGNDDMVAGFYWGNAIKYMTRYRNKNGLEDLKKARKNLDWLIEHTEAIE